MRFGGISSGTWAYRSESDPRWNMSGRAEIMSVLFPSREAEVALAERKRELGEPPADLEYLAVKD